MKKLVSLSFIFFIFNGKSQNKTIDSLKFALKFATHDTIRCKILNIIVETESDETIWPKYNEQLKILTEEKLKTTNLSFLECRIYKKYYAGALNNCGVICDQQGDVIKSLDCYIKSLKMQEEIGNKEGIAASLLNIGAVYSKQGNINNALDYFRKSLKIDEEISNKQGIAQSLNNIGVIYKSQGDLPNALDCYLKSLKTQEIIGDQQGIVLSLNNVGSIYKRQGDIPKTLEIALKALRISEKIGFKFGITTSLKLIGDIYYMKNDMKNALHYYREGLVISEDNGDKIGITNSLNKIGSIYLKQKKYFKAIVYSSKSMVLAKELAFPEIIRNAAEQLTQANSAIGNYKLAYENHQLYISMRDSINNQETRKALMKSQFKYEYEKQVTQDSLAHAKENVIKNIELQKQKVEIKAKRNQQYALYGGLILILIFTGFIYSRFKVTQKQKNIIELKEQETERQKSIITQQKYIVEEKQKEILDSINYAKRIQYSLLASDKLLKDNLKNYFLFFKPKDVVSGDFYWGTKLINENFVLATADSTGHGVPGAIMSMLNISCLNEAINADKLSGPADILNATRQKIIEHLSNDGSAEGGKDGMDCSLISFDFKNKKLVYVAANNPVWIIRGKEFIALPADRMPVGKHDKDSVLFTQYEIELQSGDMVYTLTDGFPDQFGGPRGKKFKYKQLEELLISIAHKPMESQKQTLNDVFETWKGNLEQVDDVCVIGVRI